jgi:hypothetical protein
MEVTIWLAIHNFAHLTERFRFFGISGIQLVFLESDQLEFDMSIDGADASKVYALAQDLGMRRANEDHKNPLGNGVPTNGK